MKDFQGSEDGDEDDDDDHAAFPTLERALKTINPHGGFNIEIKWDMELKVNNFENKYVVQYTLYHHRNRFTFRTALVRVTTRSSSTSTSTSSSKQY